MKGPIAWAFQKDSEFVECFSYHLQKISEGGLLKRLEQKIHRPEKKGKEGALTLGYENMAFPCFVVLMGAALALLQLTEEVFKKWAKDKVARRRLAQQKLARHAGRLHRQQLPREGHLGLARVES